MSFRGKQFIALDANAIIGAEGDIITNTAPGFWSFNGATINGATFVGYESLAQSDFCYWVDSTFPDVKPFYSTIQNAINAAAGSETDKRFVINVLPGQYDGFIIDSLPYITVQGIGEVRVGTPHTGVGANGIIKIKDTNNCYINNLRLWDKVYDFDAYSPFYIIELENASASFSKIKFDLLSMVKAADYTLELFHLGTASGNININDCYGYLSIDCAHNNLLESVQAINFIDPTNVLSCTINNSQFKLYQLNNGLGSIGVPTFEAIYINSTSTIPYFCKIKNTDFEISYSGLGTPKIIDGTSLDKVLMNNCFSNTAIDISVMNVGCTEDVDFIIPNELS